jgi:hypothetical protein
MNTQKIKLLGNTWTIKYDKNRSGGEFWGEKFLIIIGTKYPQDIPAIIYHEIIEIILSERGLRYNRYSQAVNDGYMFVMNHKEFENVIMDITSALWKFKIAYRDDWATKKGRKKCKI